MISQTTKLSLMSCAFLFVLLSAKAQKDTVIHANGKPVFTH